MPHECAPKETSKRRNKFQELPLLMGERSKDSPVADYANQTLPTLQKHLQTAQLLASNKSS
jgi:hypothetical protein